MENKYHFAREIIFNLRSCHAISENVYLHWIDKLNEDEKAELNPKCFCLKCYPNEMPNIRFNVCSICGNKRCPHASDHNFKCTNSNELKQVGELIT